MTIKEISQPIANHLAEYNKYFKSIMNSDVALLNLVIQYITKKKGKQVRPVLVFLSAELCGGANQRSYIGASLVELLHTATLVHDDVVDEAAERRGMASINASWNNKIAVLIGDYLLAKGLLNSIDNSEFEFLYASSEAVRRMSEGELLQIQKSRDFSIDEESYFKIITNKTASLMASCCLIGAISATKDKIMQEKMRDFGELIGTAFQIRDDIFDYQQTNKLIGKPVGNDLKEKKITLPLLYSMKNVSKRVAKEYMGILKKGNLKKSDIQKIINFVNEQGGIEYAENKSKQYSQQARDLLGDFKDCAAKTSLINFCDYVIERKK